LAVAEGEEEEQVLAGTAETAVSEFA